jgi:hypothetical protein
MYFSAGAYLLVSIQIHKNLLYGKFTEVPFHTIPREFGAKSTTSPQMKHLVSIILQIFLFVKIYLENF